MAKRVRRVVRKVKPSLIATIDDQLWPINIVLLILGGFITGEVLVFGDFTTPAVLQNGWTWLTWVWFAVIGTMLLAWKYGGRTARRTQLSGALALVFTLFLLTACYYFEIFTAVAIDDVPRDVVKKEEVLQPDFVQLQEIQRQQIQLDHQKPVETVVTKERQLDVEQQTVAVEQPGRNQENEAEAGLQPTRQAEPSPRQLSQSRRSTPRQADTTGQLSRQVQPNEAQPEKVASPSVAQQNQPKPAAKVDAQTQALAPRKTTATSQRPQDVETPTTQSQQPKLRNARRPTPTAEQPQLSTSRPTLRKAVRQPVEIPKVQQVAQQPPAAGQQLESSRLEPAHAVQRQQAASPNVRRQTPDTELVAAQLPKTKQSRAAPAPRQPELARSELPGTARAVQTVDVATTTSAVPTEVGASPRQAAVSQLQPDNPVVQRRSATAGSSKPSQSAESAIASTTPTPSANLTRPRNAKASSVPSALPNKRPSETTRRTNRIAQSEASPIAVSSPATVQSSLPNRSADRPRATAHSVSRRGVAGAGAQRNLDRGDPAPRTVTEVASASARRSRATAELPDPSQLTTSRQARVAKNRAMADAPTSTLQAQALEVAIAAGANEPGELDASSSAAMRNSSAAQNQGNVTADAGSTDFDTGPTQIASEMGTGRAAGGGEPELHHATQTSDASRLAPLGGDELAALDTQAVAPEPTDTPAEGGGRPPAPAADSQATAASRARDAAGAQAVPGQPGPATDAAANLPSGGGEQLAATRQQRSTAASEVPTGATAGGGTDQPARPAGVSYAAATKADALSIEAEVGGQAAPAGVDAATGSLARQGGGEGVRGRPVSSPTGAAESDVALNVPDFGAPGSQGGIGRSAADGGEPGPAVAAGTGGAPLKQSRQSGLPGVAKVTVDETELAGGGLPVESPAEDVVLGAGEGSVERRKSGGTQVLARAEPGTGGIGLEPAADVGNPSRKAQRTSDVVTLTTDARFQQRDVGGPVHAGDTRARDTQSAFEGRKKSRSSQGTPGARPRHLEVAIRSGLEFLRLQQSDNGSWSFHNFRAARDGLDAEAAQIRSDTAATGLSLMSFLGAGYDHFDFGGEYAKEVQLGLDFLVNNQQEDGNLYVDQDATSSKSAALYSHAIATMALCEAYGMTRDPKLKVPAGRAIAYIQKTQHPKRGGWRYLPGSSSDLSVTGWMFAALKSGELAGLEVPQQTLDAALDYLDRCKGPGADSDRYVYNPHAPKTARQQQGRRPSRSMTAVGLLMRLYQGRDRSNSDIRSGADYLMQQLPQYRLGQRDTYYWYYATQVMFHMKGHYWETWQRRLHELLRETQEKEGPLAGSWNPQGPIPDRWGGHGGRIYVTTMNLLSLEVSYRYLPLYVEVE